MEPIPPASPTFGTGIRLLLGLLGAGSFGAGVLAVFTTENGTGTAVLLAFGGALLVLALLGNRIDSFEFGGAKLRLRAVAARLAQAAESERRGDRITADRLRDEAEALLMSAVGPFVAGYESVRGSMRSGPDRTRLLEEMVVQARDMAAGQAFDPAEVSRWLREGSDGQRVTALAVMEARPELRDFEAVRGAIAHPRSPYEQYHSLLLATKMIDGLDAVQRGLLFATVKDARGLLMRRDASRWRLSEEILDRLTDA